MKEDHRRRAKEEAHRQAIADAIRKKWEDPEYRLRMLASRAGKKKERKEKRRVTLKKATPEANEGEAQKVHHLSSRLSLSEETDLARKLRQNCRDICPFHSRFQSRS